MCASHTVSWMVALRARTCEFSYFLYGSGAGEVEVVVLLGFTVVDDQQEVLV